MVSRNIDDGSILHDFIFNTIKVLWVFLSSYGLLSIFWSQVRRKTHPEIAVCKLIACQSLKFNQSYLLCMNIFWCWFDYEWRRTTACKATWPSADECVIYVGLLRWPWSPSSKLRLMFHTRHNIRLPLHVHQEISALGSRYKYFFILHFLNLHGYINMYVIWGSISQRINTKIHLKLTCFSIQYNTIQYNNLY